MGEAEPSPPSDIEVADAPVAAPVPPPPRRRVPVWISRPLRWLWIGLRRLIELLIIVWAALAIRYSNLPWPWARVTLAIGFAMFSVWALWVSGRARLRWAFVGAFAAVVVWWACIPPSHDRQWRGDVAVLPRATI